MMLASRTLVRTLLIACFATAMTQANGGVSSAQPNPPDNSPSLFKEVKSGEKAELDAQASKLHKSSDAAEKNFKSTRDRVDYIHLKWDELIKTAEAGKPTVLRLFKDLSIEFVPEHFKKIPQSARLQGKKERFRWSGRVKAKDHEIGQVVFVVNMTDSSITGTIRYKGKVFRIRPLGNNRYEVTKLRLDGFPEEDRPRKRKGTEHTPPRKGKGTEQTPPPKPLLRETAPCIIDVMVLFTKDAQAASSDIEGEIYEAFVEANVTFENSGVNNVMVQPAYIGLLDFRGKRFTSIGAVLDEVGNDATSSGIEVKTLREGAQADLVSLWIENSGNGQGHCGIGYLNDTQAPSDINGFAVVRRDCATEYLSFTHETGHNLGLRHDRYSERNSGQIDENTNYGHVSRTYTQRTIMATNEECLAESGNRCDRLSFWSSPNITYPESTEPMGIASGQPEAADDAAVVKRTACLVANFH